MFLVRILTTLLLLVPVLSLPAQAAVLEEPGWVLEQTCSSMGKHRIYLAPAAIKIVDLGTGNTLVSTAPDWVVRIYNDHSKRLFVSKQKEYASGSNPFVAVGLGVNFYNPPLNFKEKMALRGMPVSLYVTPKIPGEHIGRPSAGFDTPNGILRASYYVSGEIKAPKAAEKILVSFYGLPDKNAIPIELHYDNDKNEHMQWLTTTSLKTGKLKTSEFSYPKNYQVARREVELLPRPGTIQVEDVIDMSAGSKN